MTGRLGTIRLAVVEDDELLRNSLKLLVSGESDFEVVGLYSSAEAAITPLLEDPPDMALIDIGLPGQSGIDLIRRVKAAVPEIELMAHTIFDHRETVFSAIKAGASGYVLKGTRPSELIENLYELMEGGAPMSPKIARSVIAELQDRESDERYLLTPRERQILLGLESGKTYNEIAEEHNLSSHTVHTHVKKIYQKLHASGRQEALLQARRKHII
ncbi:MAG: response regulator transcription factor [Alkalispirochaeta sp.]